MLSEARADHKESDEIHMRRKCESNLAMEDEFRPVLLMNWHPEHVRPIYCIVLS
jgi:hypothetical protein